MASVVQHCIYICGCWQIKLPLPSSSEWVNFSFSHDWVCQSVQIRKWDVFWGRGYGQNKKWKCHTFLNICIHWAFVCNVPNVSYSSYTLLSSPCSSVLPLDNNTSLFVKVGVEGPSSFPSRDPSKKELKHLKWIVALRFLRIMSKLCKITSGTCLSGKRKKKSIIANGVLYHKFKFQCCFWHLINPSCI